MARNTASKMLKNYVIDPDDITQEAALRFFKNINKIDPSRNPEGLVVRITHNLCMNALKKRKNLGSLVIRMDGESLDITNSISAPTMTPLEQDIAHDHTREIVSQLDEAQARTGAYAAYIAELRKRDPDAPATTNAMPDKDRKRLSRARKSMAEALSYNPDVHATARGLNLAARITDNPKPPHGRA